MTKIKPTIKCKCGEKNVKTFFTYNSPPKLENINFSKKSINYIRYYDKCDFCGHFFSRHSIDISDLYSAKYISSTYGDENQILNKLQEINSLPSGSSDNELRCKRINNFFTDKNCTTKKLLDVGSGIGVFPLRMLESKWNITAIEMDDNLVSHLKKNLGIASYNQDFLKLEESNIGKFDLITFNKVLEHIESPDEYLSKAGQLIKEGGVIYIEVPDCLASIEGSEREEFLIEHHHIFSPISLMILVQNSNLKLLSLSRIIEPSGKYTIFAFLGLNDKVTS